MRRFLTRALAISITALALLAPVAQADPPKPKGEGKPVFNYILDFGPITYWDADYIHFGAGTADESTGQGRTPAPAFPTPSGDHP